MAQDSSQSKESDLDRTDKLPILQGVIIEDDVADDAVRMDATSVLPSAAVTAGQSSQPEFSRPPGVDLPSLAESVRSVEERIARQNAEYEALSRLYEKSRDSELAAMARTNALTSDLAALQTTLAVEQHRSREMDRTSQENQAAAEAARTRAEEALRESARHQSEARTLRDSLAAREATLAQSLHSLGERDAQLNALQREHAQTVPALEARSQASAQLEAELESVRSHAQALTLELQSAQQAVAALTAQRAHGETELAATRRELGSATSRAESYLETLRTRDWRRGFDQNLIREWDQKIDAAQAGQGIVQAERDRLEQASASLSRKLAEQEAVIAQMQNAAAADAAALAKKAQELEDARRARTELTARIVGLESDRERLRNELSSRDQALSETHTQVEQIAQLEAEAETHEQEMTVLMAHLTEARRPIQSIQADVKRLSDELVLKNLSIDQLTEDNRTLRASLERTRGALEEREFLIRRLERSESNNANVLGRIQTSIERLGSTPAPPAAVPVLVAECSAELIRIDGQHGTVYPLVRRTRIGRATGCEVHIDSNSVSRHHALLLKGTRDLIIEDLNSTNGVVVNGRKVSRQLLNNGDLVAIGDVQFRVGLKPARSVADAAPEGNAAGPQAAEAPEPGPAEAAPPGPGTGRG
jgi:FHA domain-containing protein